MKKVKQRLIVIMVLTLIMCVIMLSSCASRKSIQTTTKTQTDSVQIKVKAETSVRDCTIIQLPQVSELAIDLDTDSSGSIKPFSLNLNNTQSSVSVQATGKKRLTVKLNTSAQMNNWHRETAKNDSLLSHQQHKAETEYVVRVNTEYKTPWYDLVIIIALSVIVLLQFGYILINRFWKS